MAVKVYLDGTGSTVIVDNGVAEPNVINLQSFFFERDDTNERVVLRDSNDGYRLNVASSDVQDKEGNPIGTHDNVVSLLLSFIPLATGGSSSLSSGFPGAFGEDITAHLTPIVQIANKYQIDPAKLENVETFEATGGVADNDGNLFRCQSGTSVGGYGVIRSKETLNYRAGQGLQARFTAGFTDGVANSIQFAGMFNLLETVAVGYDGADFSIIHSHNGSAEVQLITVTATGAGTCTVTLDDDSVGITVTNSSVEENAYELQDGLEGDPTISSKWRFEQVGDKVFCISKSAENKAGTFSISGGVTATIAEKVAGVDKTHAHTPQSDWNITSNPFVGFNPHNLNIYRIQYGYLGIANILISVYNPNIRRFIDVHQIKWANEHATTHTGNPNFKVGWASASLGSSGSNLTVIGASAAIMLEGDEVIKNNTFAEKNTVTGVDTTLTNLLTLKNRIVYGDRFNLGKFFPLRVSVDNEHNKGLIVEIYRNADVVGVTDFRYKDEYNSIVLSEKQGGAVTGGTLIDSFIVSATDSEVVDITILDTETLPEDRFTIAARTVSGTSTGTTTTTATWKEEK